MAGEARGTSLKNLTPYFKMSELVRRIFVDSRLRTAASVSNSDFAVDLPFEVVVPAGTECRIDGLICSHSWESIQKDVNDKVYIEETPAAGGATYHRIVTLPPGTYSIGSLANALQSQLAVASFIADGTWTVTVANSRLIFANTSSTASAIIYSQAELQSRTMIPINWQFPDGSIVGSTNVWSHIWAAANVVAELPTPTADACEMIGLRQMLFVGPGISASCEHADLARHKVLYLCSNSFPSSSMDLRGRSDIVRQIIIGNSGPGEVVVDRLPRPTHSLRSRIGQC